MAATDARAPEAGDGVVFGGHFPYSPAASLLRLMGGSGPLLPGS